MSHVPLGSAQQAGAPTAANRRNSARLSPYWLNCDMGTILDLSNSGMRVVGKRKPKDQVTVRIWDERVGVQLLAEVMWSKKIGFRQHESGLRFIDPDPQAVRKLGMLASHARPTG
jgi:hypothetical protein